MKNNEKIDNLNNKIESLEIEKDSIKIDLLNNDSRLAIEKNRFEDLTETIGNIRRKKDQGIRRSLNSALVIFIAVLYAVSFQIPGLIYISIIYLLTTIPRTIELIKIIKNKKIEKLENTKETLKKKIYELEKNNDKLQNRLRNIYYYLEEIDAERSIRDEIEIYLEVQPERNFAELSRSRKSS